MTTNSKKPEVEWENIIDSIPDFFSIHDMDQKIVFANKPLVDFFGVSREEIIGKYCYEVFHGTNEPWKGCVHLRSVASKETAAEIVDDPNIGFPLMISCSPFYDTRGKLSGTVHIAKNMTDQHLVAEETENLISELVGSLADSQRLSGFLPICASCKNIRDDKGDWKEIESHIQKHSSVQFSHSICPDCSKRLYPGFRDK